MANVEIWACPECGAKLDISDLGFYKEVSCPACAHQEVVHTQLANFRLTGVLGIGGMSVVFKANDMILNRPLAIKVLNDTYKDQPERIARFENECAMMARVRHDNVVSVYSAGWARGQFYIAMEQVRGHDLEHTVRRGKTLSPAAALDITREVSLGLQAAAQSGLLHRDMKPGNVLISQVDGRAKVLDFGLSLGAQTEDTEEVIWATPFYVAPETLMREQEDVRTDIYALGMTLRFLLTGNDKLPQEYSSVVDLLEAKKKLPPFGEETPGVTTAVVDLVNHMTAFEPSQRPPSYQELLQELDEALVVQKREDSVKAPERIARKKRNRYIYMASTAIAALAGMAVTTLLSVPEPSQEYFAVNGFSKESLGDIVLLDAVARSAANNDWDAVKNKLEKLAGCPFEPAMAAMAALLRYYLAYTDDDKEAMDRYLSLFDHYVASGAVPPPSSAVRMHAQLEKVYKLLHSQGGSGDLNGVESRILWAVVTSLRVESVASGGMDAVRSHLSYSKEAWQNAGFGFSNFARRLEGLTKNRLRSICKKAYFAEIHKSMLAHDFSACNGRIDVVRKEFDPTRSETSRLDALKEISSVAAAAVDMLKKRFPKDYYSGMQPAVMRDLASKAKENGLPEEMFCLGLLMKGDYASAFKYNPYKSDQASSKPFAVLMRHWEKLLSEPAEEPVNVKTTSLLHIPTDTRSETLAAMRDELKKNPSAATTTDSDGNGPLHRVLRTWSAVVGTPSERERGASTVMRALLESAHNIDINLRNNAGNTPLDVAVGRFGECSSPAVYLVGLGATGSIKKERIATCRLLYGILNRNLEICETALSNGADVRRLHLRAVVDKLAEPGMTEIVKLLLDNGMDPNARDPYGIIHLAAEPKTVELLLKKGANPNLPSADEYHLSPLFTTRNVEVAEVLVRYGADVNYRNKAGMTPLFGCMPMEKVRFLLSHGADIKARANDGSTCLHYCYDEKVLDFLISQGIDVNVRDNNGNTPMHTLISQKYTPSSQREDRARALYDFLRKKGADQNIKNKEGETPLDVCIKSYGENSSCARYMRAYGAKSGK